MKTSPTLHAKGPPFIGHGESPLGFPPDKYPDAGEGAFATDMYGGPILEQYPEGTSAIELKCWHNYHLSQPMPKLFPTIEENQKMWQSIHIDRMMDYMPAHEIHAKNLPDYHFWPMILNEELRPLPGSIESQHTGVDKTDIPRFHKNGVPKTPPHQQVWYLPRLADGRFNWKKNLMVNSAQQQAYCSETGWNARYFRYIFRPWISGRKACRQANVQPPAYFVHHQRATAERYVRWLKGGWVVVGFIYLPFYASGLCWMASHVNPANYANYYWPLDGPWNPDMLILGPVARDKGAYHTFP